MTVGPYGQTAWAYRAAGWVGVLPLPAARKGPPPAGFTGWAGVDPSGADVQAWCDGPEAAGNVALRLPDGVYGLDVDAYNGKTGAAALEELTAAYGPLPDTWTVTSRDDGVSGIRLYHAQLPAGRHWRDEPAGHGRGIEAIHVGHRYAVVAPSVHPDTGAEYRWVPEGMPPRADELPWLPAAWVEGLSDPGEASTAEAASHAETLEAVRGYPDGEACARMRTAAARGLARLHEASDGAALHPAGRDATMELVGLGHDGHSGARRALSEHYSAFVAVRVARGGVQGAAEAEWWRMVRGAVGKTEGSPPAACDCGLRAGDGVQFDWSPPAGDSRDSGELDEPSGGDGGVGGLEPTALTFEQLHRDEIMEEGKRLRIRDAARELFDAFKHARNWSEPLVHGPLDVELQIPDDAPQWRIEGMLGAGHNAVLVAGRKTGKTTMVNELVRAYVDGVDFLGTQPVTATGRGIAVFNYEVGDRQYRRWLREVKIRNTERVHLMHLRGKTLPLLNPHVRKWVTAWLANRDIGLWVLDPYSRAYLGSIQNGNDEAQVSAFLDTLDTIKHDAGVDELVMPVHSPKGRVEEGAETAIGSQRLEGWPDALWYLTRDGRQRYFRAEGRDIDVTETQLDYDDHARRLTLQQFGTDRRSARERAKAAKEAAEMTAALNKLIEFIGENPECTTNAIRDNLGLNGARLGALIVASKGRIMTEPGPNRSTRHFLAEHDHPGGTVGRDQKVPPESHPVLPGVGGGGTTPEGGSPHPPPLGGDGNQDPPVPPAVDFDLAGDDQS